MRSEVWAWRREAAGDRGARSVHCRRWARRAGEDSTADWERGRGRRAPGTFGVETQRLIERRRALPRVERRAYDAGRGADRATAAHAACTAGKGSAARLGVGHAQERTSNMRFMSVTLDVSKLSGWLNTLACPNMPPMVVTLEVSKLSGWLNADAL
eukprot:scaffold92250_cov61-Phaeocystis_antarctica.AAC.2